MKRISQDQPIPDFIITFKIMFILIFIWKTFNFSRVWAEIGSSFDELRQILISPDIKTQIEKDKVDLAE